MVVSAMPVAQCVQGSKQSFTSPLRRYLPALVLALVLVAGFWIRMRTLVHLPLWVDEAESSLNALSILQHGYPTESYLGLPLFENILIKPWPGNPEYEFKDISYTDRGIAAYHAWLPLYAIAGSLRTFGIQPDTAYRTKPAYDEAEEKRRTLAVRLPSVFFGMLSLLGLYFAGIWFGNRTTGLIAAVLGSFLNVSIWFSQQARYYAATMAAMSLCTYMAGRLLRRGSRRDSAVAGLSAAVLFYCHSLCFAVAFCMLGCCIVIHCRGNLRRTLARLTLFSVVSAGLTVPWMLATGFLQHTAKLPNALRMVDHPGDLFLGRALINEYALLALIPFFILILSRAGRLRPQLELVRTVNRFELSFFVLLGWTAASYAAFVLLMPIASFFRDRLELMCLVPVLLLVALACTVLMSAFRPKLRVTAGIACVAGFVLVSNNIRPMRPPECTWYSLSTLHAYLQRTAIRPDTRMYASPNEQFVLTFYTGMPFQAIAPVRKSFLDSYQGPVFYIERTDEAEVPGFDARAIQRAAREAGIHLSNDDAWNTYCDVLSHDARIEESAHVARVWPAVADAPTYVSNLVAAYKHDAAEQRETWAEHDQASNPIFKGRPMYTVRDWWTAFFYGLSGYESRRAHPNWEQRFRNATAESLRCGGWMVFRSR